MKPTTETIKTQTVPGDGVDADVLLAFLADVPGRAAVSMRRTGGQLDAAATTITARWTPEGEAR